MDLQARMNLTYDQKKKVLFKNASGIVVGMMALAEPVGTPDGPLDELQRQVDADLRGADEKARALLAEHGRLVVAWGTPEEVRAFEASRRRVN